VIIANREGRPGVIQTTFKSRRKRMRRVTVDYNPVATTSLIVTARGKRVILDADLACIYGVPTKRLNEQVRRNTDRFPPDFAFVLTDQEVRNLRSQNATSSCDDNRGHFATGFHGGRRYRPYVFTEHGAIMAANVLNSPQAARMSVFVVRAFVKLREMLATHKELAHKLAELERKLQSHDESIRSLVVAIRQLMVPPEPEPEPAKKRIGFIVEEPKVPYITKKKKKS
jgi:hypothetical protein